MFWVTWRTIKNELTGLTSGGTALDITIEVDSATGVITITGKLTGTETEALSITLTPTEDGEGNVDVSISAIQSLLLIILLVLELTSMWMVSH